MRQPSARVALTKEFWWSLLVITPSLRVQDSLGCSMLDRVVVFIEPVHVNHGAVRPSCHDHAIFIADWHTVEQYPIVPERVPAKISAPRIVRHALQRFPLSPVVLFIDFLFIDFGVKSAPMAPWIVPTLTFCATVLDLKCVIFELNVTQRSWDCEGEPVIRNVDVQINHIEVQRSERLQQKRDAHLLLQRCNKVRNARQCRGRVKDEYSILTQQLHANCDAQSRALVVLYAERGQRERCKQFAQRFNCRVVLTDEVRASKQLDHCVHDVIDEIRCIC
mmetsp:Transcript_72331/g.143581  ORF Transcript_72331/g.143581 Transcript_72331/m.143581 type:complete len:277 (-) Transcript_72331:1972-2802(-)